MTDSDFTVRKGLLVRDGNVSLRGDNKELRFYEGANYVGFEAPALSADKIWVLPAADGSTGQALKTDGSGNLGWVTAASLTGAANGSTSAPAFAFASDTDTGLYLPSANSLGVVTGGNIRAQFQDDGKFLQYGNLECHGKIQAMNDESASAPSIAFRNDSNTGIYTGGSDIIGFSTGGTSRMTIAADGTVNVVGAFTVGGSAVGGASAIDGLSDATTSGTQNVGIGTGTFTSGSFSSNNGLAVGYNAGQDVTTGSDNTLLGSHAGSSLTIGQNNVAIGRNAMAYDTASIHAIAIGSQTGENSTGDYNLSIGSYAGRYLSGHYNINIGKSANDSGGNSGSGNVVIGHNQDLTDDTTDRNLIIAGNDGTNTTTWITGTSAGVVNIPGSLTVAGSAVGGASSLDGLSDVNIAANFSQYYGNTVTHDNATYNTSVGSTALDSITTGSGNTCFGAKAGTAITDGYSNIMVGSETGTTIGGGASYNIGIGGGAMGVGDFNGSNYNIGIGAFTMRSCEGGDNNIGIGGWSAKEITSGSDNIGMGYGAIKEVTTGSRNIGIGGNVYNAATAESDNIAIGFDALGGAVNGAEKNVIIGNYAGYAVTSGDENVLLGHRAGSAQITGTKIVAIGADALYQGTAQNFMTAVGHSAGYSHTGTEGVLIGSDAGYNSGASHGSVIIGRQAGYYATGSDNIAIGRAAMFSSSSSNTGASNVAIGRNSLYTLTTGGGNISIGENTLNAVSNADYNVAIGYHAGQDVTSGGYGTFIGFKAGYFSTSAYQNVAIGGNALYGASGTVTGGYNTAVGYNAQKLIQTGTYNNSLGNNSLLNITTGSKNIGIGYQAADNITTGSNNVMIGGADAASATGDDQLSISSGDGSPVWITGDSAGKIKIGPLTSPVTEGMLTVSRDDATATGPTLLLLDGDDDANNGPSLKLYRDSSSPADNDALGNIGFTGEDSAGGERTYAKISAIAKDVTSGTNDGALQFKTMVAGTQEIVLELENGAVTINEAYTLPTAVTGANDRVLTAQTDGSTAWAAASAPATAGIKSLGQVYDTESWNVFQAFNVASYTNSLTLNYFASHNAYYLYPFTVPRTGTLDKIHCRCMTAGASGDEITLALYDSNSNGVPEGRAAIGGPTTFSVSSTGYLSVTGINTSVSAGDILWFALTPSFGTWPGTCKLQGSLDGIPSQTGRVLGFGATSIATTGVSRYGTFSGDPPSTHSDNWQYKHGAPTGRFILMWGEYT